MTDTLKMPYEEAAAIVEDQVFDYLLMHRDPVKTTDLIPAISVAAVTPRVVREILGHSTKFVSVNRKWDAAIRHAAGSLTVEKALDNILVAAGKPVSMTVLLSELAILTGRTEEYYSELLPRFLKERSQYVPLSTDRWAWHEWILRVADTEDDVLFENFFMSPLEAEVEALGPVAAEFAWNKKDVAESALRFVNEQDISVSNLVLSFYAWKAAPDGFDPVEFFNQLLALPGGILLSECRWCPISLKRQFERVYHELGQREEDGASEEPEAVRDEQPLQLDTDDVDLVFKLVAGSGRSWRVPELVETGFDLTEGDRGYDEYVQQLNVMMVDDERFLWVGTDRWREAGTLPEFIFDVPDQLTIQQYIFEDENSEPIDVELDDRGLDEGLVQAMTSLLVQDYGDRDADFEGAGEDVNIAELWVLRHHRETGTLPVLPAFRGLFPPAPDIIELMISTNTGHRFPVWLNDTLETLYGFGQWFIEADIPMSGAMFTLSRTHVPGEYRLDYSGAVEPRLFISQDRLDELEMLKLDAESDNPLPTYEVVSRVMDAFGQKGISFTRIWTEVNVVRRTTRHLLASILSAYQCFVPVTKGGDVWWYDEKRVPLGINKQKKKYIRNIL